MGEITERAIKRLTETVRILLVDDDESVIEATDALLNSAYECKLDSFKSAIKAIEYLQQVENPHEYYRLAIIDLYLKNEDGTALVKWLKQQTTTPCVIITGYPGSDLATEASSLGVIGIVAKPLDASSFEDIFRTYRIPIKSRPFPYLTYA